MAQALWLRLVSAVRAFVSFRLLKQCCKKHAAYVFGASGGAGNLVDSLL